MTAVAGRPVRTAIGLVLALVAVNLSLTFENVWPTPWVRPTLAVSPDLALVLLGLALWFERCGRVGRGLHRLLAALIVLGVVGRYAEVTAPALYGRPVNLYWDARHLPRVAAMLAAAAPPAVLAGVVVAAGSALVVLWAAGRLAAAATLAGLGRPRLRRLTAVVAGTALLLPPLAGAGLVPEGRVAQPVAGVYGRQLAFLLSAALQATGARALPSPRPVTSDLGRLAGSDLYVIFFESYGATVYDNSEYAEALAPAYARLERILARTGRGAASAFVTSPTFGGSSWLAHASLLSGVEVAEEGDYELLLTSRQETLVSRFRQAGYRTVALLPGLHKAWPEGAFYGFDRIYDAPMLDYQGPAFGWWGMPDQWSLACLHDREVRPARRPPLFVVFATMTSHFPFLPVPPYASDWARLCGPSPYAGVEGIVARLAEKVDWNAMGPVYVRTIEYNLDWLAGYLDGIAPENAVFVVLGDHQPAAQISGPGARWEVPVHVIGPGGALLDALRNGGFAPGLTPRRPALGSMPALRDLLLTDLNAG